jgi:hypothetical protein
MAERQLRFLAGVTGHDVTKIKTRCLKCGGIRTQSSAAVLSGALPAETAVPAPPDLRTALRRPTTTEREPQRSSLLTPPPLPTASEITALNAADTIPSPSFESFVAAVSKDRKFK